MKSLLLTLMILIISSATFAAEIDGRWIGTQGSETIIFEFKAEGKKLYGLYLGSGRGDEEKVIVKGKVKTSKKKGTVISFEVPVSTGGRKMSVVYTGEVIDENTIEFTIRTKTRGSRNVGFDGFNDGFGSGGGGGGGGGGFSSGFGGGGNRETKLIIKRSNTTNTTIDK